MNDMAPAELIELMKRLPPEEQRELDKLLTEGLPSWLPQVGPQTRAYESEADIIFTADKLAAAKLICCSGLHSRRSSTRSSSAGSPFNWSASRSG